ncbi:MAG: DUF3291 domain-containing protein [Pseudomonadota bacterium]
MGHISATRLHVRRLWFMPAFMSANEKIIAQLRAQRGFIAGKVLADRGLTFWTCTLWDSSQMMHSFRDSAAHGAYMPKLLDWCDEATVAQWRGDSIPAWEIIHTRIREGRKTRLRFPNAKHELNVIPPPRPWLPERPLTPLTQSRA